MVLAPASARTYRCDAVPVGESDELRDSLRGSPVFQDIDLPVFEPQAAPATPDELFVTWFQCAVDSGVCEPHAVTLSTVDGAGRVRFCQRTSVRDCQPDS